MPKVVPFVRHLPPHLVPPPAREPETNDDRRTRQLALTRELTELNMLAARDAAHRIANRDGADPDETSAAADPTLALARATRAVTGVINLENRIAAGERAPLPAADDPRGPALRELLHPLAAREPDPARRRALRNRLNERIDDALATDLDDDLPLAQLAYVIATEFGLPFDFAKVPDRYLDPLPRFHGHEPRPGPERHEADSRDQR